MPNNYILLDRIELNASAASITFDNIPQTGYTDLKLVVSARTDGSGANSNPWTPLIVTFNSTTTSSSKQLYGTGSGTGSDSSLNNVYSADTNNTASTFSSNEIYIPNYTGSNNKSYSADSVTENNATAALALMAAGLTNITAAIISVTLQPDTNSFAAGSTFSLYGIAAVGTTPAIAPKADGGNVIGTDGTYWYHAFLSNGTFTPQVGLTADVLQIAGGGGGGGYYYGGGGGAGGLLSFTGQSLASATSYAIAVGAGGAGGSSFAQASGASGSNSQFAALTASVGGGFGARYTINGGNGGSGGGAGADGGGGGSLGANGGTGTSGQGNNGGRAWNQSGGPATGGGGGGATGAGANGAANAGGAGGAGSSAFSTWSSATSTGVSGSYAGGGGGGSLTGTPGSASAGGGAGGGTAGTNATPGTGGGGGGVGDGGPSNFGGNGGSGIIIVRYPVAS
jgi:hypothetical protein